MGTIYPRGQKLWIGYKDTRGEWKYAPTPYRLGEEKQARKVLDTIEARVEAEIAFGVRDEGELTVGRYKDKWLERRRARGLSDVKTDAGRLCHLTPEFWALPLAKVRPRHVRAEILRLKENCGSGPDQMAPRSVRHIYGTLHTMFRDAVADELIDTNPCVVPTGELPKKIDKDPTWRRSAIFTKNEVEAAISDERIPMDRRVVYALLFLAGLRFGEAAALRWRSYEATVRPLGRLSVVTSYSTRHRKEKAVKTEQPREVPVHATLAKVLAFWRLQGWAAMMGRAPNDDDLIIPSRLGKNRNVNHALRRFHQDLERLGIRPRRQHDLRRTFITLARADGARKDVLEWVTHGPRGDIVDLYTTLPWELLCEAVAPLKIELRTGKVIAFPKVAQAGGNDVVEDPLLQPVLHRSGSSSKRLNSNEKIAEISAGRTGLEPAASGVTGRRYNQLNYRPEAASHP